jgi:hypothetical protein
MFSIGPFAVNKRAAPLSEILIKSNRQSPGPLRCCQKLSPGWQGAWNKDEGDDGEPTDSHGRYMQSLLPGGPLGTWHPIVAATFMTCVASHGLEIEKQLFYHFFIILASSKLSKKHHLFENNYHFLFFKVSKIIAFLSLPSSRIIIFLII